MKKKYSLNGSVSGCGPLTLIYVIFALLCWSINLYKFVQEDFEAPYKTEVIHGVGVFIPVTSIVTVWF